MLILHTPDLELLGTVAAAGAFASMDAAILDTVVVNVAVVVIVVVVEGIAVTGGVRGGASNEDSLRVRLYDDFALKVFRSLKAELSHHVNVQN